MNNNAQNSKKKKNKVNTALIVRVAMILLAFVTVILAIVFIMNPGGNKGDGVVYNVTIEAGDVIDPNMFLYGVGNNATFQGDVDTDALTRIPGSHPLVIMVNGQEYNVTLTVKDTVPPTATALPMMFKMGGVADAEVMVREVNDVTDVKVSFDRSPNMAVPGKQNVTLRLVDAGGNVKEINTLVYIVEELSVPTWEIGTDVPAVLEFASKLDNVVYQDTNVFASIKAPGEYCAALRVTVANTGYTFYAPFKAVDTVAPVVTPKENYIYDVNDKMPSPDQLIADYIEHTQIRFEYLEEYSISEAGVYILKVKATDSAGNYVVVDVSVTAFDGSVDNGAPIITVNSQINMTIGGSYDLSGHVTIYDDKDGAISLTDSSKVTINDSEINNMLPGSYHILVTVTDSSGKVANATVKVEVSHLSVSGEKINEAADKYLESVIKEGMSFEEKIMAIYQSVLSGQGKDFSRSSDKNNDKKLEAYYGLTFKTGDSYTVACMMELLLSRVDIRCQTVERTGGKTLHYWNLVDFSDGWYHVDGFFNPDKWVVNGEEVAVFKLTDAQLADYTAWHNTVAAGSNYYQFKNSQYPQTPIITGDGYVYNPYKVIYTVSDGGYIEGDADQEIFHGMSTQTVKAIPASGYKFIGWSDGVKTVERRDLVYGNLTVTALFEQDSSVISKNYILTYTADVGGTLKGAARQSVKSGYYGSPVVAIPDAGYKFAGWSDGVTSASRTDISNGNMSVVAFFVVDNGNNHTIEYNASIGGSISGKTVQVVNKGEYGSTVTAVAAEGYMFNSWSDGVTTAERSDLVIGDFSVTAYFVPVDATLYTVTYLAGEGGEIEGILSQRVIEGGSTLTVTAVSKRGYVFAGWSDGVTTTKRNDVAMSDITVTAIFIKLNGINVSYKVDGVGGSISGEAEQYVYSGETTTQVVAVADEGYKFISWSDGVTTPERSDKPDEDLLVFAVFEELESFTFSYTATEGGSISGQATQKVYVSLQGTTVVAIPDAGYKFVSWSDGVKTAERTDVADGDISVEAVFAPLNKYTVTYLAGQGGHISGSTIQSGYEGEFYEMVAASPDDGYEFVEWSDGVKTAERTDVAYADVEYTAIFAPVKVCMIYYTATAGGYIDGELQQTIYIDQRGTVVTAVASEGYVFKCWSDGVTTASRSDVATNAMVVITAIFEAVKQ